MKVCVLDHRFTGLTDLFGSVRHVVTEVLSAWIEYRGVGGGGRECVWGVCKGEWVWVNM